MGHLPKSYVNIIICNRSAVWWYGKTKILHHADNIYQRLNKKYVWWISIRNHRYRIWMKQNIRNGGNNIPILLFSKARTIWAVCSTIEICSKISTYFGVGLETPNRCMKKWYKWRCVFLLEIVVWSSLYIVMSIYGIGFRGYEDHEIWIISKG